MDMTTTDQQDHAAPDTDAADVEAVATALCQSMIAPRQCPCLELGKFMCDDQHPGHQARAAIAAYQARLADTGRAVMSAELSKQQLADGVLALIDAGLDGPDGVGHSEVQAVWRAIKAAQS